MKIARVGGVSALVALFASSAVGYAQELDDGTAFSGSKVARWRRTCTKSTG
jgi:hypothetical protein